MKPSTSGASQRRTVRSFVRRSGRLTPSQQRAIESLWPVYGIEFEASPLNFDAIFGRDAPRILEIGFGNGDTLVQLAIDQPEHDFIGIEVHEPGIGHCLIRLRETGINNVRVIAHDALEVLECQIPVSSLHRINLYFPDPWPKKRHHKRRIVQTPFLELCANALKSNGTLHIATDWANYAEHIDATFAAFSGFRCTECRVHNGERPLDRPRTKFEQRGLRHGHKIWDWSFVTVK
ncbi:MAG: tRNA (guanosine(46)-N7)-methyltransferase TrmB [Gammaproteobacteria bacterium]|nr:tRNA (guanosine(46)-N7)-methyltransferase TrmB [Gammaproteobacteria bacterium]